MIRVFSQFGGLILLILSPLIVALPSHAHGSEPHHRPKKEARVADDKTSETNSHNSDTMMSGERESEMSIPPAIAEENPAPQSTFLQTAGMMPQGLGETLSVLLVAVPAGLYALKYRR